MKKLIVLYVGRVFGSLAPLLTALFFFASSLGIRAQPEVPNSQPFKRSVTVADAIDLTRLADPDYFHGGDSTGRISLFSPDRKLFLILLRKGNLGKNTNEFSLLLYHAAEALRSPKPEVLLKMSSSSSRDAISHVRWLSNNRTILFLGENPGQMSQVYQFEVYDRHLVKRTNSAFSVTNYDCSADGRTILFAANSSPKTISADEMVYHEGVVIRDQSLGDLQAGRYGQPKWTRTLHTTRRTFRGS